MIEASKKRNIIIQFFTWYFIEMPKNILIAFGNILVFNLKFFSIGMFLKTLFSHWRRFRDPYGRGFSPKRYASVFISNTFSRIIGAIIRAFVIIIGLIVATLIFVLGILIFFVWIFLPVIIICGFCHSIQLLV